METLKITQGDSSPLYKIKATKTPSAFSFASDEANWSCKQTIVSKPSNNKITLFSPVMDTNKQYFNCYLRPHDTESLEPGSYVWTVEVSNLGEHTLPQVRKELLSIAVEILPQMV